MQGIGALLNQPPLEGSRSQQISLLTAGETEARRGGGRPELAGALQVVLSLQFSN